ncbi:hypothetical protein CR513_48480, partial [Mucuna pruriens]
MINKIFHVFNYFLPMFFFSFSLSIQNFIHSFIRIMPKTCPFSFFLSFKKRVQNDNLNIETSLQIDNGTLELNNANKSSGQDEGEGLEEALVELERPLEQEGLKLQFGAKELETINLDEKEKAKEIRVGKEMPPAKDEVGGDTLDQRRGGKAMECRLPSGSRIYTQWMANIVASPQERWEGPNVR